MTVPFLFLTDIEITVEAKATDTSACLLNLYTQAQIHVTIEVTPRVAGRMALQIARVTPEQVQFQLNQSYL